MPVFVSVSGKRTALPDGATRVILPSDATIADLYENACSYEQFAPRVMPNALQLAEGNAALIAAVVECRKLLHRRSLVSAAASAVPVPGLDWAVDAAMLSQLIPQMNARFGLTPEQMRHLGPRKREHLQKAINGVGSLLIGKTITRELILRAAQVVGVRMTAKTAAKYVPFAGQAVAALVGYSAVRYLGEQHLKECVQVVLSAKLALPAPELPQRVTLTSRLPGLGGR